jgi:hypothetical protein
MTCEGDAALIAAFHQGFRSLLRLVQHKARWTWPDDCGHIPEAIPPHLSDYDVGLEPVCEQAILRLTSHHRSA